MRAGLFRLWTALILLPALHGAAAAVSCTSTFDSVGALAFGTALLGEPRNRVPASAAKQDNCVEDFGKGYFDCEYVDKDGVSYLVEGNQIIRKEIRDLRLYSKPLLADVAPGDTIVDVLKKLRSLPADFPVWHIGPSHTGDFVLGTHYCLTGGNGEVGALYLVFSEQGTLYALGARTNW